MSTEPEEQEAIQPTPEQSEADKLSTSTFIQTQRAKYLELFPEHSTIDAALKTLKETYEPHTIAGVDDKDGYDFAKNGLKFLLGIRQGTEAKFKDLNSIAKEYTEALKTDSGKIILEVQRLEKLLKDKVKAIDDAKQAIKDKAKKEKAERFVNRTNEMFALGFVMKEEGYVLGTMIVSVNQINDAEPEAWAVFIHNATNTAKIQKDLEEKRKQDEENLKKTNEANAERIAELEKKNAAIAAELEALRNPKPEPVADTVQVVENALHEMVDEVQAYTSTPDHVATPAYVNNQVTPHPSITSQAEGRTVRTSPAPSNEVSGPAPDPQPARPSTTSPMIVMMEPIYRQFRDAGKSDKDFAVARRRIIMGGNCVADAVIDLLTNHPKCQRSELIAIVESMKIIDPQPQA